MGFFRQEYWSELPLSSPGDLPNPKIESGSPALQAGVEEINDLDAAGVNNGGWRCHSLRQGPVEREWL